MSLTKKNKGNLKDKELLKAPHDISEYNQINLGLRNLAEEEYRSAVANHDYRRAAVWKHAFDELFENNNMEFVRHLCYLKWIPVSFRDFMEDPELMGEQFEIYPKIMDDLIDINPDIMTGGRPVTEVYLGGGTGIGKTTQMITTCLYQTYLAQSFESLPLMYGLAKSTGPVWTIQSAKTETAKDTIYMPIRRSIEASPFFKKFCPWDNDNKSKILFENGNMSILVGAASLNATIGRFIYGGSVDEMNFFKEVDKSKRAMDPNKPFWSQAEEVYSNLSRRRTSRIRTKGFNIGSLTFSSSVKYEGDFLTQRIRQATKNKEKGVFWSKNKIYEVKPTGSYSDDTFRILVGTKFHPTRILGDNEKGPQDGIVEKVPVDFRIDFERNPDEALRDVCGIASMAIEPFITRRDTIKLAFDRGTELGLFPLVNKSLSELAITGMPSVLDKEIKGIPADQKTAPHHVHIDLSLTGDRCGIAMARLDEWKEIRTSNTTTERLPVITIPLVIALEPTKSRPIDLGEVRGFVLELMNAGFNIASVSYDGFQSADSIQILRKLGLKAFNLSMDKTVKPYIEFRKALYDDRLNIVPMDLLEEELIYLEHNTKRDKIDHTNQSTKDVSDAACGAFYHIHRSAMSGEISTGGVVTISNDEGTVERAEVQRRDPVRRSSSRSLEDIVVRSIEEKTVFKIVDTEGRVTWTFEE